MFHLFEGKTADEVWQKVAAEFRIKRNTYIQKGRGGKTNEILHAALSISDPRQRWITSRRPALNPGFAIAETIWILRGRNDAAFLNYFNSQLPKFAGYGDTYAGAYGHRLRNHVGFDQLKRAYFALKRNPESRQIVLQLWDARLDFPQTNGLPSSPDVPCNVISMLKIRNSALEWTQIMRSNDLFRGLPHNVVQFTTLQEVMSGWLKVKLGTYNHFSDSLHAYEGTLPDIQKSLAAKACRNIDSLALPKKESEKALREVERVTDLIVKSTVSAEKLLSIIRQTTLPRGFRNLVCVLCAEGARRRKCTDEMDEIMSNCSNPVFNKMFFDWNQRCS